ncbi:putative arginase [Hortaea werneckii]|nr:putative arginase [Hortaea werneckii]
MGIESITLIASPYHVGLRDHRVGDGPNRILNLGLRKDLESLGIPVYFEEIPPVDDFEGEIGRSFEVLRRQSDIVRRVTEAGSFPLVLSGNCMATAGIACGLNESNPGFIYFDAHDDMDTPSTNTNGYFDAMGLSILAGKSWHALSKTIPGFAPKRYDKFLYCGLRDMDDGQRKTVEESGADAILGGPTHKVDFPGELRRRLQQKEYSPALVHLDLDVLDQSVGMVNGFESAGGLSADEVVECMTMVPSMAQPLSLTVCSFNPNLGDGDKVARIAIQAITGFVKTLMSL